MAISPGLFLDKLLIEDIRREFLKSYRSFRKGKPGRHVDRGMFVYAAVAEYCKKRRVKGLRATIWPANIVKWIRKNYRQVRALQPADYDRWRYGALGSRFMEFKSYNVNWEKLRLADKIGRRLAAEGEIRMRQLERMGILKARIREIQSLILSKNVNFHVDGKFFKAVRPPIPKTDCQES